VDVETGRGNHGAEGGGRGSLRDREAPAALAERRLTMTKAETRIRIAAA